jgi:hypothetical protein
VWCFVANIIWCGHYLVIDEETKSQQFAGYARAPRQDDAMPFGRKVEVFDIGYGDIAGGDPGPNGRPFIQRSKHNARTRRVKVFNPKVVYVKRGIQLGEIRTFC